MKRLMSVIFISLLVLTGCGSDPVHDELLNYINTDMKPLAAKEQKVLDDYDSVTGNNYTDDETLYNKLIDEILPEYRDFISELEGINIETKELSDIHEKYIDAANTQQQGLIKITDALEKQNIGLAAEANQMLTEGRKGLRDYQKEIKNLAKEHNVEFKN